MKVLYRSVRKASYSLACLWHKAVQGRKKEDIINSVYKFLRSQGCEKSRVVDGQLHLPKQELGFLRFFRIWCKLSYYWCGNYTNKVL